MASASPPFLQMPSATSALRFVSMSRSATFAPSDARRSAYARPIPWAARVRQPVGEALPRRDLRIAGLRLGHLRVQVLERSQIVIGHERHREAHGVALEENAQVVGLLDVVGVKFRDSEAAIGERADES